MQAWPEREPFRSTFRELSNADLGPALWGAIAALQQLGLVEEAPHLVTADDGDGSIVFPYTMESWGHDAERRLAVAAEAGANALLTEGQAEAAYRTGLWLAPAPAHIKSIAMVGIFRTRYRAPTTKTGAWIARRSS